MCSGPGAASWRLLILTYSKRASGGIAKGFAFDDGSMDQPESV
jgi:hypothetical protein